MCVCLFKLAAATLKMTHILMVLTRLQILLLKEHKAFYVVIFFTMAFCVKWQDVYNIFFKKCLKSWNGWNEWDTVEEWLKEVTFLAKSLTAESCSFVFCDQKKKQTESRSKSASAPKCWAPKRGRKTFVREWIWLADNLANILVSLFHVSLSWIYIHETSVLTRRKIEWHFWNDCSTWREAGGNPPGCIGNDSSKEVWANVQTWRQTCQIFLEKHINTKSGSSIFFLLLFSIQPIPLSFVFSASLPFDLLYCLCHSCIKKLEMDFTINSEYSDIAFSAS